MGNERGSSPVRKLCAGDTGGMYTVEIYAPPVITQKRP
jgi:hypothetical protein